MNPYKVLGLEPGATADQIKAAFRRAASKAHPDRAHAEGDMAEINAAHDLLSDPERRARYDATGDVQAETPIEVDARSMLLQALQQAIDGNSPDPVAGAGQVLSAVLAGLQQHKIQREAEIRRMTRLVGRFKTKSGENLAAGLVDAKLKDARAALKQLERGLKVQAAAAAMLSAYSFEAEPAASQYQFLGLMSGLQSQTGSIWGQQ